MDLVDQLNSQEERLRKTLNEHAVRRTAVATRRNNLLPIHRLPFELLSWIFVLCCDKLDSSVLDVVGGLMLVCSRWRDTALSTPRLFTKLVIQFKNHSLVNKFEHLSRYLDLSQGQSLEVLLHLFDGGSERVPHSSLSPGRQLAETTRKLRVADNAMRRCVSLHILKESSRLIGSYEIQFLKGNYPLLRHLRLTVAISFDLQPGTSLFPFLHVTAVKNLESIAITSPYHYKGQAYDLEGPTGFNNVTRLALHDGQDPHSIPHLIRSLPNLKYLSWYDEGRQGPQFNGSVVNPGTYHEEAMVYPGQLAATRSTEYFVLSQLEELRLSGAVPIMTLRRIEAPSLRSAALFAYESKRHDFPKLEKQASGLVVDRLTEPDGWPPLSSLELFLPSDSDLLYSVLSFQENLEELTVYVPSGRYPESLSILSGDDNNSDDEVLCPHLRMLRINIDSNFDQGASKDHTQMVEQFTDSMKKWRKMRTKMDFEIHVRWMHFNLSK